jgi:CRISPR-associated protein Cas2
MIVLLLESVSPSLRGDLSRWLIEIQAGVFVGRVNELIREALWMRTTNRAEDGTVVMIWRTPTEQGFEVRSWNAKQYVPINLDGIWLTLRPFGET